MEKKLKGSWIVHHTQKLQGVTNQTGYERTYLAGKAGILLSALSSNKQATLTNAGIETLANAANINTAFELPKLLDLLSQRELIDRTASGAELIGVTTAATLQHTAEIFDNLLPPKSEQAAIDLAELASTAPLLDSEASEKLADTYALATQEVSQLLFDSEQIGFVDVEKLGKTEKLFFNGNLFRRETTSKINAVLTSLSSAESAKLSELTEALRKKACMTVDQVKALLGDLLFTKVASIGLFDINVVSNNTEEVGFVTLPSAFSKFSSSIVDDAFDLAKAFVSSITYGMTKSHYERGQIQMVTALLRTLVQGEPVGPVRAIAEDYKVLELKGVVRVQNGIKKGRSGPMMWLLKKEVGELALGAIREGDVSAQSLSALPTAAVTRFHGPETNRERSRRQQVKLSSKATNDMISVLRKGVKP